MGGQLSQGSGRPRAPSWPLRLPATGPGPREKGWGRVREKDSDSDRTAVRVGEAPGTVGAWQGASGRAPRARSPVPAARSLLLLPCWGLPSPFRPGLLSPDKRAGRGGGGHVEGRQILSREGRTATGQVSDAKGSHRSIPATMGRWRLRDSVTCQSHTAGQQSAKNAVGALGWLIPPAG